MVTKEKRFCFPIMKTIINLHTDCITSLRVFIDCSKLIYNDPFSADWVIIGSQYGILPNVSLQGLFQLHGRFDKDAGKI